MSRIHDALLKAEQERHRGTPLEDEAMPVSPDAMPELSVAEAAAPSAAHAVRLASPPKAAATGPITVEMLEARCRKHAWKVNSGKLVQFSAKQQPVGAEEFRTLRSRLYQIRGQQPLKTLLVASALPGEGKTFVSANLAQSFVRQRGRRVLLIDGDLRYPRLHAAFGADRQPGLADILKGEADEYAAIQRGPIENLYLLPGGKTVSNAAELISGGGLRAMLERLSQCFDWIVIDSPAAIPISDASVLAGMCDGVLLVVDSGSTPFDLAQKARQEFKHRPVVGVVINRIAHDSSYSSYYAGNYGQVPEAASKE
jgi:protein-tyrosine kinase